MNDCEQLLWLLIKSGNIALIDELKSFFFARIFPHPFNDFTTTIILDAAFTWTLFHMKMRKFFFLFFSIFNRHTQKKFANTKKRNWNFTRMFVEVSFECCFDEWMNEWEKEGTEHEFAKLNRQLLVAIKRELDTQKKSICAKICD